MERNNQKNGLVNLTAAILVFIAAFAVTVFSNSAAGQAASVFLGIGVLVAFASWFQMRLEENERLEKLEVEDMARAKGESALFESKESELFAARRSREQFEKFFIPGFAVLLFLLEAGGAALLWRWIDRIPHAIAPDRAMSSLSLFAIFALILFVLGRFSVTIARLGDHRLLRPGSSFLLAGAYVCFLAALGIAGVKADFIHADVWAARIFCGLLGVMAVEILLTLLLEIYRPRVKGRVARPLYDSRVIGILAQPESLFTTAAQTLDYQFGFKVSETWFFQVLKQNLPLLLLAQFAVLVLSTSFVFVDPGEQAVLERFGRPLATLDSGAHLKLPWPLDKVYRYRTDQIQTFVVGYVPDAQSENANVILWSTAHAKEENFLVGNRAVTTVQGDAGTTLKAPPVSLITISIPVQFQITDVRAWAYQNTDPAGLLQNLATRAVVQFLAGQDLGDVLSHARLVAAQQLQSRIQAAADDRRLGVKILFVGLQDIHPPVSVAADYERVVGAEQQMIAKTNNAVADAIRTNTLSGALAFSATNIAEAFRIQRQTAAAARVALFTNQIPAFEAAPSVYQSRMRIAAIVEATKNSRKYILLTTNTQDVIWLNLEDTIASQMLNATVPSE